MAKKKDEKSSQCVKLHWIFLSTQRVLQVLLRKLLLGCTVNDSDK